MHAMPLTLQIHSFDCVGSFRRALGLVALVIAVYSLVLLCIIYHITVLCAYQLYYNDNFKN